MSFAEVGLRRLKCVMALLELVQISILEMRPKPLPLDGEEPAAAGGEAPLEAGVASRLQLVYAHVANAEPLPRYKKKAAEPTISVRGYVRVSRRPRACPRAPRACACVRPRGMLTCTACARGTRACNMRHVQRALVVKCTR